MHAADTAVEVALSKGPFKSTGLLCPGLAALTKVISLPCPAHASCPGADVVGSESLIQQIQESGGSNLPFDKCIATPDMMPKLGKVRKRCNRPLGGVKCVGVGAVYGADRSAVEGRGTAQHEGGESEGQAHPYSLWQNRKLAAHPVHVPTKIALQRTDQHGSPSAPACVHPHICAHIRTHTHIQSCTHTRT